MKRLWIWLLLLIVCTLWLGQGFALELDASSGRSRRVHTVFGVPLWHATPEATVFSERPNIEAISATNWIPVGERSWHEWGATDCFCIHELETEIRDRQVLALRDDKSSAGETDLIWKFVTETCLAELRNGAAICEVTTQAKAFLEAMDRKRVGRDLQKNELQQAWRNAGAFRNTEKWPTPSE